MGSEISVCLAVPAKVIELLEDDIAIVEIGTVKMKISTVLTGDISLGDYVLVHAGFAIEKIDKEEAERTIELFREIERLDEIS